MDLFQQQPRGKGADDAGQSRQPRQVGEQKSEEQRGEEHDPGRAQLRQQLHYPGDDESPDGQGSAEEENGDRDEPEDRSQLDRLSRLGGGDDARDDREHDQSQHVVDDRGAEDDLGFPGVESPQVLEYPGRDPDAGGAQHAPHEQVDVVEAEAGGHARRDLGRHFADEHPADSVPQDERGDDPDDGDDQGGCPHLHHPLHARFQPDLEQEDDDAEARQPVDDHGPVDFQNLGAQRFEEAPRGVDEDQVAQDDAADEFPEHRRHMEPLEKLARPLGGREDEDQGQQQRGDGIFVGPRARRH